MIVVACSARKRDPGFTERDPRRGIHRRRRVPLYQLYDGPAWRMVRKRYAAGGELHNGRKVWALSALHGLVPCYHHAEIYDHKLETAPQALELADGTEELTLRHFRNDTGDRPVLLFGSRLYGFAFNAMMLRIQRELGTELAWRKTTGGIGDQLGALRFAMDAELRS